MEFSTERFSTAFFYKKRLYFAVCASVFGLLGFAAVVPKTTLEKLLFLDPSPSLNCSISNDSTTLNSVTVVTAYYPIPSKASPQQYLEWISNFLPHIPCNLYIFTDTATFPVLQSLRSPFLNQTKVVVKEFSQLQMAKTMEVWTKQKALDHESYHTPELYVIWHEKTYFVQEAISDNPFQSEYFIWCDIGAFRYPEEVSKLLTFPNAEKMRQLDHSKLSMLRMENFTDSDYEVDSSGLPKTSFQGRVHLGGTILVGSRCAWAAWEFLYSTMLRLFLGHGRFAGKDQDVYASVAVAHPDALNLIPAQPYFGNPWFYLQYHFS